MTDPVAFIAGAASRRLLYNAPMVTVGMNYSVLPGKEDLFISVFEKVLGVIREAPGHAATRLCRDVFEPGEFVVVSEWDDESAFEAFIASERFRNVVNWGRENVLAGRPQHRIYGSDSTN